MTDPVAPGISGRLLVTGGSGFVGRRLVARLGLAPDAEVLSVRGPYGEGPGAAIDLCDAPAVRDLVTAFRPDTIVHLAAFSSVGAGAGQADRVWRSNFDATRALAEAARDLDQPVRLLFASTAEVYGRGFNDGPRAEEAPLAPASAYARSKAACEYLLRDLAGEALQVVALRLFNHTGPGQDERFVVPGLAAQLARLGRGGAGEISVGNLEAQRDFTDVEDMIDAYLAVLAAPAASPGTGFAVYNVGSGRQRSIQSILDRLIALHGAEVRVLRDPARLRASDIPVAGGCFERFGQAYSWRPRRDFEATVGAIYAHELALAGA